MITKQINPNKVIRFILIYSSEKNGDMSQTFYNYCEDIFPTITVVLDTSGGRFGRFYHSKLFPIL